MKVMLRKDGNGRLVAYLPKKDLEEAVAAVEMESPGGWGGLIALANGMCLYIEPMPGEPRLPLTVEARQVDQP